MKVELYVSEYLHPPNDCIDSLRTCFHSRLKIVGGEGYMAHAPVALQRVGDVLVALWVRGDDTGDVLLAL